MVDRKLHVQKTPASATWTDLHANHTLICHSTGLSSPSSREFLCPPHCNKPPFADHHCTASWRACSASSTGSPSTTPSSSFSCCGSLCPPSGMSGALRSQDTPRILSNGAIGVPKSSSAPSWLPRSAVTSAGLPPLACVLRPTRPSKRPAPQDLSTNRGRAWPLKLRLKTCSTVTVQG